MPITPACVIFSSLQYFGRKRWSIGMNLSYNNKTVTFVVGNHHKRHWWSPICGTNTPPKLSYSEQVWATEHRMCGGPSIWNELGKDAGFVWVTLWHTALMEVMWAALGRGLHVRTKCTASVPRSKSMIPRPMTREPQPTPWIQLHEISSEAVPRLLILRAVWEFKLALCYKVLGNLEDSDR